MNIKITPEAKEAVMAALYKAKAEVGEILGHLGLPPDDRVFWEQRYKVYCDALYQVTGNRPQLPP